MLLFWKIGRLVFEKRDYCENSVLKCSDFFSYCFGRSDIFSVTNVHYMEKFYKAFPVYLSRLDELSFEHYKLLVSVSDIKRRYFYFWLAIFCRSNVTELKSFIYADLYSYI